MDVSIRLRSLVWKNIKKHRYRNIATIICFVFVAANLFVANYLVTGVSNSLKVGLDRLGADITVVSENATSSTETFLLTGQPSTFYLSNSCLSTIAQVPGVSIVSPQLYIASLADASCCSEGTPIQLIGFDPSTDFTVTPWLTSTLGRTLNDNEVIVGNAITSKIGSHVTFYGHIFTIAGKLDTTGMGLDYCVFMTLSDAYEMAAKSAENAVIKLDIESGQISAVLVRLDQKADLANVTSDIQNSIVGIHAITSNSLMQGVTSKLASTTRLLYITTASVTLISIPLIAVISSMVANERRKEIGLLRAMGGSKKFVFKLVFTEAMFLAVAGGIIGVLISLVGLFSFQNLIAITLKIPFIFPSLGDALIGASSAIGLAVAIGSVASLFPSIKSCNLEPYEAIRSGDT